MVLKPIVGAHNSDVCEPLYRPLYEPQKVRCLGMLDAWMQFPRKTEISTTIRYGPWTSTGIAASI